MITPEEIVKRAERKYRAVLRAWVCGENLFPLEFPAGRASTNLPKRRQQIEALRQQAKEVTGQGYDLAWKTVNKRKLGKQTVPHRVIIDDLDDYLALVRKRTEFDHFTTDVRRIRQRFPSLVDWVAQSPGAVIDYHGEWDDLLAVCAYFVAQPRPGVYIRELPISVHTKFIESHTRILRDLLDQLLPLEAVDDEATTFTQRYGLRDKPPLVRLRLLDAQLDKRHALQIDDLTLPVAQMAHLLADQIQPRRVIIVENLINFLTLPPVPAGVGVLGGGFAVHLLAKVDWLRQCDLIYWGDIDAHGFQILSDLRGLFPQVRSVMMDRRTLDANAAYQVPGSHARTDRFDHLTDAEAALALDITERGIRLEQEHIPHDYALAALEHGAFL